MSNVDLFEIYMMMIENQATPKDFEINKQNLLGICYFLHEQNKKQAESLKRILDLIDNRQKYCTNSISYYDFNSQYNFNIQLREFYNKNRKTVQNKFNFFNKSFNKIKKLNLNKEKHLKAFTQNIIPVALDYYSLCARFTKNLYDYIGDLDNKYDPQKEFYNIVQPCVKEFISVVKIIKNITDYSKKAINNSQILESEEEIV